MHIGFLHLFIFFFLCWLDDFIWCFRVRGFFLPLDRVFCWFSLLHFHFLYSSALKFLVAFFNFSLLYLSFCSCIVSWFLWVVCVLLNLKQLLWILWQFVDLYGGGQLNRKLCSFGNVLFPYFFCISWSLALLPSHLKKEFSPPVFTDWLWERAISPWVWCGILRLSLTSSMDVPSPHILVPPEGHS